MTDKELQQAFRAIGLALYSVDNTVTTDMGIEPVKDYSWRVDNSKEIELVHKLEKHFKINTDSYLGHNPDKTNP